MLLLELRGHDEHWVRERLGDSWLGFDDDELKRMMETPGLTDVKVTRRRAPPARSVYGVDCQRHESRPHERPRQDRDHRVSTCPDNGSRILDRSHALDRGARSERILILDGAMGTMIQRHKLTEADFRGERFKDHPKDLQGNNDLLILTRPDVIREIHVDTSRPAPTSSRPTPSAARPSRRPTTCSSTLAYELNFEGARLAKAACDEWTARTPDRPRFVAGSIGPTNRTLSISPEVNNPAFRAITFDELRPPTRSRSAASSTAAADLLLLETIFDTLNAKAGIVAIENVFAEKGVRLPLMISFTITDKSGRTLSGQTLEAFYASVRHAHPFSIGINCALGARDMRPYLADLARIAECYVSSYPNAGLPNAFGQYDELPAETSELCRTSPPAAS